MPTADVVAAIQAAANSLREELEDNVATQIQQEERGIVFKSSKAKARRRIEERLAELPLFAVVSGKAMLARLSDWSKSGFGVSFGAAALAREIQISEMPTELTGVIKAIQEGKQFPPRQ